MWYDGWAINTMPIPPNTSNIVAAVKVSLNARNLLTLAESAELTRLEAKFDKRELTAKEDAFVWKCIERLEAAAAK